LPTTVLLRAFEVISSLSTSVQLLVFEVISSLSTSVQLLVFEVTLELANHGGLVRRSPPQAATFARSDPPCSPSRRGLKGEPDYWRMGDSLTNENTSEPSGLGTIF
jgi:hypothetical protein